MKIFFRIDFNDFSNPILRFHLDDEQAHQLTPEQLRQSLRKQLEYYFSRENMVNDRYLKSKMDAEDYVSIATIADFNLVKRMTHDLQLITDVLKGMCLLIRIMISFE